MKPWPMELRVAIANAYDDCESSIVVAEMFGVSESGVRRLIQRRRETGSLEPKPNTLPDNSKLTQKEFDQIDRLIRETPDITLGEIADKLAVKVSVPTIHRATVKLELTVKKKRREPQSRTTRR